MEKFWSLCGEKAGAVKMADTRLTESQRDAVNAVNGTLLVAAAAGSGKTAVLVERVIGRLTQSDPPTTADRLLIVTFTRAAAAEMRARIMRRLRELMQKNPRNQLLLRQSLLLSQAKIGTIDSFCADMVKEFFQLLDISPDFKILSDREQDEYVAEALRETISEAFENGSVRELADAFSSERDDRRLMGMVKTLYDFMQSHPYPQAWLEEKTSLYFKGDISPWEEVIFNYTKESASHLCAVCESAALECENLRDAAGDAYAEVLRIEMDFFKALAKLCEKGDWDEIADFVRSFSHPRRRKIPGKLAENSPIADRMEALRKENKNATKEYRDLFFTSREENREELRLASPLVESLKLLTLDFSRRYGDKKRENNRLDYADLEHLCIKLFLDENGEPTRIAREVAQRFDEVMIDEYQDINEVQDALFRAIGLKSVFMVGDVKQSIYGFRRAMPEIFLKKREAYPKYDRNLDRYPAYLTLDRNFRSRKEVTGAVNDVFGELMSRDAGDIDYNAGERLAAGGDYINGDGYETELVLLRRPQGVSAEEAEGAYLAGKIREIVESGMLIGKGSGRRPVEYGDFCVLLRSSNRYAIAYARAMNERGVPARASVGGDFFETAEIGVITSLLEVIDNPNQDIPLLTVLMSPIYGFSPDDAARLRESDKKVPLYISLLRAAEEDERPRGVIESLRHFRRLAAAMPADDFLSRLYEETGYPDIVLAMKDGERRLYNLRLLLNYASEYESAGFGGVSRFVRYLENLKESGGGSLNTEAPAEVSGAVQIMSVHRSKGLEFPVVIVAGLGRNFVSDRSQDILLHPRLGLGVRLKLPDMPVRVTTTAREAIALETARSSASEELRILYVAMTRAEEKLILLGSEQRPERTVGKLAMELSSGGISPYSVRKAGNALSWLVLCALRRPEGEKLREMAGVQSPSFLKNPESVWKISVEDFSPEEDESVKPEKFYAEPDMLLYERLKERINSRYPHEEDLGIPVKVTASQIAAREAEEESLPRPAWLGRGGLTPAERGTALHEFMQFADFRAALEDPEKELARLIDEAYLTAEQGEAVDLRRVKAFLGSPLGKRVLNSPDVRRERRFTSTLPAGFIAGREGSDEEVILQGAVDCTFEEDGKLHIIDFKTDRVSSMDELWQRYGVQLELYGAAMARVTGKPIGGLWLYSMYLNAASRREYGKN